MALHRRPSRGLAGRVDVRGPGRDAGRILRLAETPTEPAFGTE